MLIFKRKTKKHKQFNLPFELMFSPKIVFYILKLFFARSIGLSLLILELFVFLIFSWQWVVKLLETLRIIKENYYLFLIHYEIIFNQSFKRRKAFSHLFMNLRNRLYIRVTSYMFAACMWYNSCIDIIQGCQSKCIFFEKTTFSQRVKIL